MLPQSHLLPKLLLVVRDGVLAGVDTKAMKEVSAYPLYLTIFITRTTIWTSSKC